MPDYVINGGGLINVYGEVQGWEVERAKRKAGEIYQTILSVFAIAKRDGIPTNRAADRMAEERITAIGKLRLPHLGAPAPRFQGRRGN